MLKNENGFALVIILTLLPALLAGFFVSWATVGFIQQDLGLKFACRTGGIAGQNQVHPLLSRLLALNPKAAKLKKDSESLRRQLAMNPDPRQKAILMARLAQVETQRMILDMQQKTLITQSNLILKKEHLLTQKSLRRSLSFFSSSFILISDPQLYGQPPRLAVRPDFSDIAPTYSPRSDFSTAQALAHEWHYQVSLTKPYAYFLSGRFEFRKACAVTLIKEGQQWFPKITKAKFSLKSVW